MKATLFQRIILPGFILQSVLIGGGYATGRELIEFFLNSGPLGGLLGILAATLILSLISMASFEFARMTQSFSYRSFFRKLLGRFWFLYELTYGALCILVLAVIGSAAGEIVSGHLDMPVSVGTITLMALICVLTAWGTKLIEKVLAGWSFLLYAVYGVFVWIYLDQYGAGLDTALFSEGAIKDGWFINAVKYVGYNIAALPLILFCVRHMQTRSDSLLAGVLAGPLAMIPALIFYLAMVAGQEVVSAAPVPSDAMMAQLNIGWLQAIFYVVLFGTFVETGTAFIHAMNERIAEVLQEKKQKTLSGKARFGISAAVLVLSIYLASSVGLIGLIGGGYGTLTWMFIAIFVVPVLTYGVYRSFFAPAVEQKTAPAAS